MSNVAAAVNVWLPPASLNADGVKAQIDVPSILSVLIVPCGYIIMFSVPTLS